LRKADREERKRLFPIVYDELHEKVPYLNYIKDKPGEVDGLDPQSGEGRAVRFLSRFVHPKTTYLEIGPGGCKVAREIAKRAQTVYAVDVSMPAMLSGGPLPENLRPIVSDGTSVPVPAGVVDLAWSDNLIEHLHPDDAMEQLENVFRALKPGGRYICGTPNRINGPHDVSSHFGHKVAAGFHLKEYAYCDIIPLFRRVGFRSLKGYVDLRGKLIFWIPGSVLIGFERGLEALPERIRVKVMGVLLVRAILQVRVSGTKPQD
jgi:SAM-dependent methyltransferase